MTTGTAKNEAKMLIREIAPEDAKAAAELSAELGYPAEICSMEERIRVVNSSRDRVVYVACISDDVVAWIDVSIVHHLSTGLFGEIAGFVVSGKHRNYGIGAKLIAKAEEWVANQGVPNMVVRSRVTREAAHRFYIREGYTMVKTSAVFSKQLKL